MALEHDTMSPLAEAVQQAGSQSAFARIIGRRQSTVRFWLLHDRPLPAELVLTVERATGVSRHALRPDIYPFISATSSPVLPNEEVAVGAPIVPGDRRAISPSVRS